MKKFKKVLALTLAMVLVLGLFSGCGPQKAAGLYENGRLVKPWDDLLKEIGYTDFDGKNITYQFYNNTEASEFYFGSFKKILNFMI